MGLFAGGCAACFSAIGGYLRAEVVCFKPKSVVFFGGKAFGYATFTKRKPARLRAKSLCALAHQLVMARRLS